MLQGPSPQDIRRIDFGKFVVLLILSVLLIGMLVLNEMTLVAQF